MTVTYENFEGKKFAGKKKAKQMLASFREEGWKLRTNAFENGSNFVLAEKRFPDVGYRSVMLNVFNGRFWVHDTAYPPRKPIADETSGHLDNEPWYAEILSCLYEEKK